MNHAPDFVLIALAALAIYILIIRPSLSRRSTTVSKASPQQVPQPPLVQMSYAGDEFTYVNRASDISYNTKPKFQNDHWLLEGSIVIPGDTVEDHIFFCVPANVRTVRLGYMHGWVLVDETSGVAYGESSTAVRVVEPM